MRPEITERNWESRRRELRSWCQRTGGQFDLRAEDGIEFATCTHGQHVLSLNDRDEARARVGGLSGTEPNVEYVEFDRQSVTIHGDDDGEFTYKG